MYFVYLLQSLKDKKYYIGQTDNMQERLKKHNDGEVESTRNRAPFRLVGNEEYKTRNEARWKEHSLKKSAWQRKKFFEKFIVFLIIFIGIPFIALASVTDGTIDNTYKYAWSENTGWVNFGCDNCDVHITDSGLSGYALSETIGWINLNNVINDGAGNLSGYAWSEN
ncbi:MAG: GIY-YIG nuclease family protein, partial [Patescibacteria group bacterium]|nr:GIY-YIG nuclease family protein [Patescibacteria group bacterium]